MEAMRQNVEGRVVLDCSLTSEGALNACQVVEERPAGMRFGEASLRLACDPRFNAAPSAAPNTQMYERDGVQRIRRVVNWRLG